MHAGGKKGGNKKGHVKVVLQDTISTPGPVHHFSKIPGATSGHDSRTFYGSAEGLGAEGINPSVIEIRVPKFKSRIKLTGRAELTGEASVMGRITSACTPMASISTWVQKKATPLLSTEKI